jgi:hypothetical protein
MIGLLLSVPIGIIYNLMISKLSNMITEDFSLKNKIKTDLLISIIAGVVALVLAFYVFGNEKLENKIVKYGLAFGGGILLVYSTICNWDSLEDMTKLFFLFSIMIATILYSYKYVKSNKKNKQESKENNDDKVKI